MQTLKHLLFQQPGVGILLFNYLLMNTGFFMMIPFVALHGTRNLGLSAAAVGVVLGLRQFVQQGLSIFGGALGDRIGYKPSLLIGLLVRAVGFATFAIAHDWLGLVIAALISAFGGAFFEATGNASLATLTPPEHRTASFSLYGIASRLGSALGPALGLWLFNFDFAVLSLIASSFYVVGATLLAVGLPSIKPTVAQRARPLSLRETLNITVRDRPFVKVVTLNAGFWFLFVQFSISLPLYVDRVFGSLSAISLFYFINSVPAVIAQYVLVQYLNQWWARTTILTVAMSLIAIGMGTIGLWSWSLLVVLSASIYVLGDLMYQPTQYTLTSELARSDMLASYFGFAAFAIAIGGGSGNVIGGWLFDQTMALGHPEWVWYVYGLLGLLLTIGLNFWVRTEQKAT